MVKESGSQRVSHKRRIELKSARRFSDCELSIDYVAQPKKYLIVGKVWPLSGLSKTAHAVSSDAGDVLLRYFLQPKAPIIFAERLACTSSKRVATILPEQPMHRDLTRVGDSLVKSNN
ncbi:hypothetical protein D3C84_749270 [compost metagenome]